MPLAVAPVCPPVAITTNTSGDVEVAVTLDKDGNVTKAELVTGHPLLRRAATVRRSMIPNCDESINA